MNKKYWIAINGASITRTAIPLEPGKFTVVPTPEQLIGFDTAEEATEAHAYLLNAPYHNMVERMEQYGKRVSKGELAYIKPKRPEAPTALTIWRINRE